MGKIVITGTGRCGTSFLMHLFTALGLNTGYTLDECKQHLSRSGCNGGIEHSTGTDLFKKSDIVKNPIWMYKPELLDFEIDTIIIPFRKLRHVAESREKAQQGNYGGFWRGATNTDEQMNIDAKAFYEFIEFVIKKNLNYVFLDFPRIVIDCDYLWSKIKDIKALSKVYHSDFLYIFNQIADINKIHSNNPEWHEIINKDYERSNEEAN